MRWGLPLFIASIISSCEQEAAHPQWDIEILGPILHAELGINQILEDSLTQTDPDGKVRVVFLSDYNNLKTDSIYLIPDTTLYTYVTNTFASFPISPGSAIPCNALIRNPYLSVASQGTPLRAAILDHGKIRITFRNIYPTRLFFTYTFPKGTLNGIPITISDSVDPGSKTAPSYSTKELDISGSSLDLTGQNNNLFNSLYYTLTVITDSQGPQITILLNDTLVELSTELMGIEPYYVSGYFGQKNFDIDEEIRLGDGRLFQSGSLLLDSATLSIALENSIGADLSAYISSVTSINSATAITVPLSAPGILNQNVNLARADKTGNAALPVSPTRATFLLDKSNSNLPAFLQNLPDKIGTDLQLRLNPIGNVSGNNDFIYKDRLIRTVNRLEIPLRLSLNALTLVDTQDLATSNLEDLDPLGAATFKLVAENGFPVDIRLQLSLLDADGTVTDQLLVPELIAAALTDASLKVIQPVTTRIDIPVDAGRKERLIKAGRMIVRASFTSVNHPQMVDLYEQYRLKLKLVADATYSIR